MNTTFGGFGQADHKGRDVITSSPILIVCSNIDRALGKAREFCLMAYPVESGYSHHIVMLVGLDGDTRKWEAQE